MHCAINNNYTCALHLSIKGTSDDNVDDDYLDTCTHYFLDQMRYSISIQKNRSNGRVTLVKAQKLILYQKIFSGHTQYASNINDDDNYDGGGCKIREAVECHEVFVSTGLSDVCKIEIKLSK